MTVPDGEPYGSTLVREMVGSSGHSEEVGAPSSLIFADENAPGSNDGATSMRAVFAPMIVYLTECPKLIAGVARAGSDLAEDLQINDATHHSVMCR
jgi:hypothetical protein